jgi:hypothetical protein
MVAKNIPYPIKSLTLIRRTLIEWSDIRPSSQWNSLLSTQKKKIKQKMKENERDLSFFQTESNDQLTDT